MDNSPSHERIAYPTLPNPPVVSIPRLQFTGMIGEHYFTGERGKPVA